jgi:hypothetical protein
MNFLRFFAFAGVLAAAMTSCTVVTSTNVPGKKETKIPKNMLGKYKLEYPGDLAGLTEGNETMVTFKSDRVIVENAEGSSESILGDSLYYSTIKKQGYLSLGKEPNLSVFRVVKSGKDIHLFSLCATDYISAADLQQYFSSVEEIPGEVSDEGEPGTPSFVVTIDDQKLDKYYKSEIPMKDPFKLIKQ